MRNIFRWRKRDIAGEQQQAEEPGYKLGEALLLSKHRVACKEHKGTWLCCAMKDEWVFLCAISESTVNVMGNHTIGVWENDMEHYGVSLYGWFPVEQKLPASILERVRKAL